MSAFGGKADISRRWPMAIHEPVRPYAASVESWIGSTIEGSSFSGLLTRVEIGHIRIKSAGYGRMRSRGSGSSLSQRVPVRGEACPEPPRFVTGYASDEWWRVAPELWRLGLLRLTDTAPLAA